MTVPLFSSLWPNSGDYKINSRIQVKGTINLYKEKLQVIPDCLDEVAVVSVGGKKTNDLQNKLIRNVAYHYCNHKCFYFL